MCEINKQTNTLRDILAYQTQHKVNTEITPAMTLGLSPTNSWLNRCSLNKSNFRVITIQVFSTQGLYISQHISQVTFHYDSHTSQLSSCRIQHLKYAALTATGYHRTSTIYTGSEVRAYHQVVTLIHGNLCHFEMPMWFE